MEWVETTGETLEEAKEAALDQLGVAEDDAEFEVIEEPKQGLFGRTRGEARVRARVKPSTPRGKRKKAVSVANSVHAMTANAVSAQSASHAHHEKR